jgi:hypothetical protein
MVEFVANTELEKKLSFGSLIASLASIPVIVMQTSNDYVTHQIGEWLGALLWLFFVCEVTILVVKSKARLEWASSHLLEIVIVIGTTPVFLFTAPIEAGHGSIAAIAGILRFGRVVKLAKATKAIKTGQKVTKDEIYTTRFVDLIVHSSVIVIVAGLLGMFVDRNRHSLLEGLWYWLPSDFHFKEWVPFLGLVMIPVILLAVRPSNRASQR